jgi:hypothetical protein
MKSITRCSGFTYCWSGSFIWKLGFVDFLVVLNELVWAEIPRVVEFVKHWGGVEQSSAELTGLNQVICGDSFQIIENFQHFVGSKCVLLPVY